MSPAGVDRWRRSHGFRHDLQGIAESPSSPGRGPPNWTMRRTDRRSTIAEASRSPAHDTPSRSVSKGSTLGFRAADHNPYGVNNDYGMINFSIEGTTGSDGVGQDAHRRVREAGVGWIRYALSWEVVQPTNERDPAKWNWTAPDYDIDAAIDQGLNSTSPSARAGVPHVAP